MAILFFVFPGLIAKHHHMAATKLINRCGLAIVWEGSKPQMNTDTDPDLFVFICVHLWLLSSRNFVWMARYIA
jgi:hypothetical protein